MASVEIAPGLRFLHGGPGWTLNCWLLDDVLVDSGVWLSGPFLSRQLRGSSVTAHALTHAHGDHAGSSHSLATSFGLPLWVGAYDADAVEAGSYATHGDPTINTVMTLLAPARSHPVAKRLIEGDVVGGFEVIDAPGHSPGAVAFWRASDRVLICGDVISNLTVTRRSRVQELPALLSHDATGNQASALKLAELRPSVTCFGHGPPVRDPGVFAAAVQNLAR